MKFVVIDKFGNAHITEADDIMDAMMQEENNHYGYSHIMSVSVAEDIWE